MSTKVLDEVNHNSTENIQLEEHTLPDDSIAYNVVVWSNNHEEPFVFFMASSEAATELYTLLARQYNKRDIVGID